MGSAADQKFLGANLLSNESFRIRRRIVWGTLGVLEGYFRGTLEGLKTPREIRT